MVIAAGQEHGLWTGRGANPNGEGHALWSEIEEFAPQPPLVQMIRLLTIAPVDLKSLEQAVKGDPQLVTDALHLGNSSAFRLAEPVARLEQAVMMMDAEITRALLIACWLIKRSGKIGRQAHQAFWTHSLLVAELSRHLCEWLNCDDPEPAFLGGLLHDVGTLPFLAVLSRSHSEPRENIFEEAGDALEPQRCRFGVDHCEIGRRMGSILGLPCWTIELAAKHHQRTSASPSFPLLCLVSAAEAISQARSVAHAPSLPRRQFILNALGHYLPGLRSAASSGLLEMLESDLAGASAQFGEITAGSRDAQASPTA